MRADFNTTRDEYIKRINFVLDFIEKNLEGDLSLEELSKKAHYSPYHFHRVFSTIVEENPNIYINRKRIERIASTLLTKPNKPIKELAYTYGFNSESSFSRSFRKYYGMSPTRFKTEGKNTLSKIGIAPFTTEKYICNIDNIKKWIEMKGQIIVTEIKEIKLAGITHIGEFDKIEGMYQRLMKWGYEQEVLALQGFKAITIYHDNPNVTHNSKVRYSTCITIRRDIKPDGEIKPVTIEKGIYAIGRFEIKGEEISTAWKNCCVWIIENGYEFRDGDYFETYHNDHKIHPESKFILDICIPLEKTENIQLNKAYDLNFASTISKSQSMDTLTYHDLIKYMKELRAFFDKAYVGFKLGNIYQGNPDYSYFSITTEEIKRQKLKFVIILDHRMMKFSICLSGQNKSIRKKYWKMFKESDWNKYHLVESIDNSLFILDHVLLEYPDFEDSALLTETIDREASKFINELKEILE